MVQEEALRKLATDFLNVKDDEAAVTTCLRLMLTFGDLRRFLGVGKIAHHRFEYPLPSGKADLVLFHSDGGLSVIEAKSERGLTHMAHGIGQVCLYAVLLERMPVWSGRRPRYVRRFLCAPAEPEQAPTMIAACESAGVTFVQAPPYKDLKLLAERLWQRVSQVRG